MVLWVMIIYWSSRIPSMIPGAISLNYLARHTLPNQTMFLIKRPTSTRGRSLTVRSPSWCRRVSCPQFIVTYFEFCSGLFHPFFDFKGSAVSVIQRDFIRCASVQVGGRMRYWLPGGYPGRILLFAGIFGAYRPRSIPRGEAQDRCVLVARRVVFGRICQGIGRCVHRGTDGL